MHVIWITQPHPVLNNYMKTHGIKLHLLLYVLDVWLWNVLDSMFSGFLYCPKKESYHLKQSLYLSEFHTDLRWRAGDKESASTASSITMDWMIARTKGRIMKLY